MDKVKSRIKTLFVGTSEFALPILKILSELEYIDLIGVITQPDRPVGRKQILTPPPVKQVLLEYDAEFPIIDGNKIKVFQPENLKSEAESILNETKPELIVVASYGQFIPKSMLDYPKYKCLNIHGSTLPDLRGAVPIQMAILKGYKETGATIQIMSEKMDEGDIIGCKLLDISNKDTYESLTTRLAELSAGLIAEVLPKWINGEVQPQKQDDSKATYCYIKDVAKENAEIDWNKSAEEIERMIRAFYPWPIAWTEISNNKFQVLKILKVYQADIEDSISIESKVGEIVKVEKRLFVKCGDGKFLELHSIQLEGKERRGAENYLYLAQ